jgi:hypothetical protein
VNSGKNIKVNPVEQSQHSADEHNEEKENEADNRLDAFTEQDIFIDGVLTRISSNQPVEKLSPEELSNLPQSFYNPGGKGYDVPEVIEPEELTKKDEEPEKEADMNATNYEEVPDENNQREVEAQHYVNLPEASEPKIIQNELLDEKEQTVLEKEFSRLNNTKQKIKPFSKMSLIEKLEYLTSPPHYLKRMFVEINTKDRIYIGFVLSYSLDENLITLANMNTFKYYSIGIDKVINIKIIGL